jgi:2-alkenal reductase
MVQTTRRSGAWLLWIAAAVLLLLLLGCALSFAVGLWLFNAMPVESGDEPLRPAVQEVATREPVLAAVAPPVIIATPEAGMDYETAVLESIYAQVNPAVVNVTVLAQGHAGLPRDVLPRDMDPNEMMPISTGSGFVWDLEGHLVTNNHVVEGAQEVQITFSDGTVSIAEVVGTDPDSDLAVLKIDPTGYHLAPVRLSRLEDVHVGMRVAAIGNPFALEGTLTSGIVSAIGRSIPARDNFSIPDSIQTDAAINPGNSGGPLLNERGEVIGVNAQIRSQSGSNSGVGFAIPINVVNRVVPALIANGTYAHSYMGVSGSTLSPICAAELGLPHTLRGALVNLVLPGTPAERAGLRAGETAITTRYPSICPSVSGGDVIIAIDDQPVSRFDDVLAYLQSETSPGDTVTLTVWRDDDPVDVTLTLVARP